VSHHRPGEYSDTVLLQHCLRQGDDRQPSQVGDCALTGSVFSVWDRSMCDLAGYEGPLNRCTIYGSQEAGEKLIEMLEMGMSRPWPEALAVLTGQGEMDATAILDYFAPLKSWLDEQNQGRTCGW
jgi:hypothetical protein